MPVDSGTAPIHRHGNSQLLFHTRRAGTRPRHKQGQRRVQVFHHTGGGFDQLGPPSDSRIHGRKHRRRVCTDNIHVRVANVEVKAGGGDAGGGADALESGSTGGWVGDEPSNVLVKVPCSHLTPLGSSHAVPENGSSTGHVGKKPTIDRHLVGPNTHRHAARLLERLHAGRKQPGRTHACGAHGRQGPPRHGGHSAHRPKPELRSRNRWGIFASPSHLSMWWTRREPEPLAALPQDLREHLETTTARFRRAMWQEQHVVPEVVYDQRNPEAVAAHEELKRFKRMFTATQMAMANCQPVREAANEVRREHPFSKTAVQALLWHTKCTAAQREALLALGFEDAVLLGQAGAINNTVQAAFVRHYGAYGLRLGEEGYNPYHQFMAEVEQQREAVWA